MYDKGKRILNIIDLDFVIKAGSSITAEQQKYFGTLGVHVDPVGRIRLKKLVLSMTNKDPNQRIGVDEALQKLNEIKKLRQNKIMTEKIAAAGAGAAADNGAAKHKGDEPKSMLEQMQNAAAAPAQPPQPQTKSPSDKGGDPPKLKPG